MSMATIKAIEARSVHQIQSGQVIVDLCSVAKELVENSVDAGATSIEIRFKNNGLDLIEVQDNGSGISPDNYENVALKHYTSKLSSYDDLTRLNTFGFRGEALSSLCALADFHVVTAQANQAPKANRLDFEPSGKLKKTQIVAGQKGTTTSVEGLFKRLPVRRRELEKNIKREYGKVLNLLHAYACVSTGVRFSVRNTVGKTRNVVVFSTNSNQTTKENIANVYGAKTLTALIPLDLTVEFEPSAAVRRVAERDGSDLNKILVRGHVSRPVFGEGRQTPDRQMFFVNSRPCGLPQIAKAFNEVYRSFNVSQSPFVFADFQMDTNAYDVNVSPDKRTILLHDAGALIDSLKVSLTQLFESSDQTVPQSHVSGSKQTPAKQTPKRSQSIAFDRTPSRYNAVDDEDQEMEDEEDEQSQPSSQSRMKSFLGGLGSHRNPSNNSSPLRRNISMSQDAASSPVTPARTISQSKPRSPSPAEEDAGLEELPRDSNENKMTRRPPEPDTQLDEAETQAPQSSVPDESLSSQLDLSEETPNAIQNAFDRMRPRRVPAEIATITIGNKTVTSMVGSGASRKRDAEFINTDKTPSTRKKRIHTPSRSGIFSKHMRDFAAPGSQIEQTARSDVGDDEEDEEEIEDDDEVVEMEQDEEEDAEEAEIEAEEDAEEEVEEEGAEEAEQIEDEESDDGAQSYAPSENESSHEHRDVASQDVPVSDDNADSQVSLTPAEHHLNDEEKKKHEESEVQRLIQEAEDKAVLPEESYIKRANKMNRGAVHRDSTVQLVSTIDGSLSRIQSQAEKLQESIRSYTARTGLSQDEAEAADSQETAEDRLSLTVTKDDFARMRIIGQFNLGFILATRSSSHGSDSGSPSKDELFIIDQHASDEKINFERLQAETIVQNQRLVQPKLLDLTAVEEEIVIENQSALEKNGFIVEVDDSGDEPIGRRCKLVSLPLSKEVVFGVRDLEELIVLLSDMAGSTSQMYIPRPAKVRKMFAMRACRSSIMIGKNLTQKQMQRVVRNMGTIDKPWNCPHGRPTMRHLMSLGQWNEWDEFGNDNADMELDDHRSREDKLDIWRNYIMEMAESEEGEEDEAEIEDTNESDGAQDD